MTKRALLVLTLSLVVVGVAVSAAASPPTVQTTHNPTLGTILADGQGLTLYHFAEDTTPGQSACSGACATTWPPLTTPGAPTLAAGVPGVLGTITRPGGAKQVTYDGMPLYRFAQDAAPGDAYGQGIGGVWSVVRPAAMGSPAATPAASPVAPPRPTAFPTSPVFELRALRRA